MLFAAVGLALGVGSAYAVGQIGVITAPAELARIAASVCLLVMLLFTPVGLARTTREVLLSAGVSDRIPRIRAFRVIGAAFFLGVPTVGLVVAFPIGVAGLFFYVWWMFAPHVTLLEGDGGRTALRRSRTLFVGEFSSTALPVIISFAFVLLALMMAERLVPPGPRNFTLSESGGYVRELAEGDEYNQGTRILSHAEPEPDPAADERGRPDAKKAKPESMPPEVAYDEVARTLTLPAPEPIPLSTAVLWAGPPLLLVILLEPIRWYVITLLYFNLRLRREGLTVEELREELTEPEDDALDPTDGARTETQ
jgi:hypothetical protein